MKYQYGVFHLRIGPAPARKELCGSDLIEPAATLTAKLGVSATRAPRPAFVTPTAPSLAEES